MARPRGIIFQDDNPAPYWRQLREWERQYLVYTLEQLGNDVAAAADAAGVTEVFYRARLERSGHKIPLTYYRHVIPGKNNLSPERREELREAVGHAREVKAAKDAAKKEDQNTGPGATVLQLTAAPHVLAEQRGRIATPSNDDESGRTEQQRTVRPPVFIHPTTVLVEEPEEEEEPNEDDEEDEESEDDDENEDEESEDEESEDEEDGSIDDDDENADDEDDEELPDGEGELAFCTCKTSGSKNCPIHKLGGGRDIVEPDDSGGNS